MNRRIRNLIILAVLLIVCVGAYIWLRQWNAGESDRKSATDVYLLRTDSLDELNFKDTEQQELSFIKTESDDWAYSDSRFPLDQELFGTLVEAVSSLKAIRRLDTPEDLSAYGLETPERVITAVDDSGKTVISIGNSVEGNYYARKDGDEAVYIISSALFGAMNYKLLDFAVIPDFPILSEATIEKITFVGKDKTIELTKKTTTTDEEVDCTEGDSCVDGKETIQKNVITWVLADGKELPSNDSVVTDYLNVLNKLKFATCADYDADAEEMTAYGLDDPAKLVINYSGSTMTLLIGSPSPDRSEVTYAVLDDGYSVYTLDTETADALKGLSLNSVP